MFSKFAVCKGSQISEGKELSSANSSALFFKLFVRRLTDIGKNNGPKIEPCGTAVSQSDVWPLSKTLWNLPLKKLVIKWNKFSLTPFCFNLNNNPSCQTLSNASDMSRNTPWVSRVRFQSKLEKMLCLMASSWQIHKSPGQKPD